jgi:hypothetical protein
LQGGSFEELSCFTPNQTIDVDGKRGEVLALFETGLQVLLIFLALLRGQDFVGVSGGTHTTWHPLAILLLMSC